MAKKQIKQHKKNINKGNKKAGYKSQQKNDEHVDDVLAWGKSKQNYYKQSQQQYSQASQEQAEAQQIYDNQYQNLNRQDYYQLPQQQSKKSGYSQQDNQDIQQQQTINSQYINNQILWAAELAKMFEGVHDSQYQLRKKVYDSYLLILMALKQYKISYLDQHPLVHSLPQLKKALQHFQKQLPKLYQSLQKSLQKTNTNYQESSNALNFQQNVNSTQNSVLKKNQKNSKGLNIYERIKNQKLEERKIRKQKNKKQLQQNKPKVKQAFKIVSENQGRLANQKILKNKVLMKRRRRDDGNSRTKLRHKYQKALIRRKAKGHRGVKQNPGRFYQGQDKILYGKIASTKLK